MELKDKQYFSRMLIMVSFFLFQPGYSVNYQKKHFFVLLNVFSLPSWTYHTFPPTEETSWF